MHLLNKINKWVHSGPYANYAEIDPLSATLIAGAVAGGKAISAGVKRKQEKDLIEKQKKLN